MRAASAFEKALAAFFISERFWRCIQALAASSVWLGAETVNRDAGPALAGEVHRRRKRRAIGRIRIALGLKTKAHLLKVSLAAFARSACQCFVR